MSDKKADKKADKKPVEYKIDMFELLKKADTKDYKFFEEKYNEEERRKASFWLMMRYMSSSTGSNDIRHLLFTNTLVNKDFNTVVKTHPDMIYKLLCVVGAGKTDFHKFIPPPKGQRILDSLAMKFFTELFQETYTDREIEIMCKKHSAIDQEIIREFAKDLYWEPKDIEKLLQEIASM